VSCSGVEGVDVMDGMEDEDVRKALRSNTRR